jgi:hypothetical protein
MAIHYNTEYHKIHLTTKNPQEKFRKCASNMSISHLTLGANLQVQFNLCKIFPNNLHGQRLKHEVHFILLIN